MLDLLTVYWYINKYDTIAVSTLYTVHYSKLVSLVYKSPLAFLCQQSYNSLIVTAAHIKSSLHSLTLSFTSELLTLNSLSRFLSHSSTADSQLILGPRYIAPDRTQQKTPFPTMLQLLGVVAETCLPSRCLAMGVYCVHCSGLQAVLRYYSSYFLVVIEENHEDLHQYS
jgi:hypothetical protein